MTEIRISLEVDSKQSHSFRSSFKHYCKNKRRYGKTEAFISRVNNSKLFPLAIHTVATEHKKTLMNAILH